ncbi:type II toxin-antitoxin system HicA family toxin [Allofrancisella guangzhouensis]|uniref:type II toxin-antitoxin system HicA family toxin n=1 Tax=Allofrancisella guangzhouensis TaxID=594679 RepID=UPI001904E590|nr:type II toxin-antitoxin system HicA family toxin [Allofrancisella guangzhouensis]MBK2044219.1 type II toxin-antitoxin system HicA family toxin [Allofrancisella guangzhouensis]MBK2045632.1 type II toxin-antitoxin system HicA family toxin [Allofrancisella guangzhouensis]
MSKIEKLITRFLSEPKDFEWAELKRLLISLEYEEYNSGKTSGSRVKFISEKHADISLHKPHPTPILKKYQIKQIKELLKKEGLV